MSSIILIFFYQTLACTDKYNYLGFKWVWSAHKKNFDFKLSNVAQFRLIRVFFNYKIMIV